MHTLRDNLIKEYIWYTNIPVRNWQILKYRILKIWLIQQKDFRDGAKNVLLRWAPKIKIFKSLFLNKKHVKTFKNKKIITRNTHGTGCTLSSAITTFLSCGKPIIKSCELGIKYVNHAIGSSPGYGKGHGPINHINSIELNKKFK